MIQLAHESGKSKWASRVNGYDNATKRTGGITNRNLVKVRANQHPGIYLHLRVHGEIVMDTVHQEMQHEEHGVVRKVVIDVEEEPVHRVLEEGEEKVAKDVTRDCFKDSGG